MRITKKQKQGVLNEDLDSKLDLLLEQNKEFLKLPPVIDRIDQRLVRVENDVAAMKVGQKNMQEQVNRIESKLDKEVDREEFKTLERRVTTLETRR